MSDETDLHLPTPHRGFTRTVLALPPILALAVAILYLPTGSTEDRIVTLQPHVTARIGFLAAVTGFVYSAIMGLLLGFARLSRREKWTASIWLLVAFPFACCGPDPLAALIIPYRSIDQVEVQDASYHLFHLYSARTEHRAMRFRLGRDEGSNAIYLRCRILGEADLDRARIWSPLVRPEGSVREDVMAVRRTPEGTGVLVTEGNLIWLSYDLASGTTRIGGDPFTYMGPSDTVSSSDVTGFLEARLARDEDELPEQVAILRLPDVERGANHANPHVRRLVLQWLERQSSRPPELESLAVRLRADPALK